MPVAFRAVILAGDGRLIQNVCERRMFWAQLEAEEVLGGSIHAAQYGNIVVVGERTNLVSGQ